MSRLCKPIYAGILLSAVISMPCYAEGGWGAEASPSLKRFGLMRSFSSKNELLLRLECDWTEFVQDDREEIHKEQDPDTTYERQYSVEGGYSDGWFSLEAGFRRLFGSGKALSPAVGVAVRVSPRRSSSSYDRHEDDNLGYTYEHTGSGVDLRLLLNAGCRYLFTEHFAVSVHSDIVSYVYARDDSEGQSTYRDESGDRSTYTDEYSRTWQYLQLSLRPSLYLQYYF